MSLKSDAPEFPKPHGGAAWASALLVGLLVAGLLENLGGLFVGGMLGWLLVQNAWLKKAVLALQLREPRLQSDPQPVARETAPQVTLEEQVEIAPHVPRMAAPSVYDLTISEDKTSPPDAASSTTPPPASRAGSAVENAMAAFKQWLRRGNPMARVGIVVLFFGGAFLAKYSAEQGLFPIELRFIALAIGALVLLGLGWRLRFKRRLYAQILQGGGIAGLYLTVFTAARVFELLPLSLTLGVLVTIAIAAAILAVGQNALSLAVIGTAGGFLAPILVSTGSGNHVALFTYYTILNLGIFTVAWFRAWRLLNWVGFLFTFGITGLFRAGSYTEAKLLSTDFFLLLFFLLYLAVSILFSLKQKPNLRGYISGSLVFGLPIIVFSMHASLLHEFEFALAFSALGFGLLYAVLAWGIVRTQIENLRILAEAFAALAVIFGSLAVPLAFDGETTAAMWAIEGAGLVWIGLRQQRLTSRIFGLLLQAAGGVGFLMALQGHSHGGLHILNSVAIGGVMLTVGGLVSGHLLQRSNRLLHIREQWLAPTLAVWATLWWLFTGASEIDHSVPYALDYGASLIFLAATLLLLILLATRLHWLFLAKIACVVLGLSLVFGIFGAADVHGPGHELGLLGWPALVGSGLMLLYSLDSRTNDWLEKASRLLHPAVIWTSVLILSWEVVHRISDLLSGIWPTLAWGVIPAFAVAVIGVRQRQWPVRQHVTLYRQTISAVLAVASLVWVISMNLHHNGSAYPLPYLPLLNPLDISQALVAVILARWWINLPDELRAPITPTDTRLVPAGIALLALYCLSAALIRALHHGFDIPWTSYSISHSFLVQSSLSVFWGMLGLATILVAGRRSWRTVWLGGAVLMGIVVVKLFLVDLSGSGTLARIVSFLSVGSLLLLAGYLSPLPPAAKPAHDSEVDS